MYMFVGHSSETKHLGNLGGNYLSIYIVKKFADIRHGPNAGFNFALEGAFFAGTGIRTHVNPWTNKKCGAVS